jgi:hypothetical protein
MTTDEIASWLQAHGITDKISTDGHVPTQPDRLHVVSKTGGPGEKRERSFDVISVQVLTRGKQRSPSDAEARAGAVDDVFLGVVPPLTIGTTRVISIMRSGGPPTFVTREPNSGRVTMACTYLLECARTVF